MKRWLPNAGLFAYLFGEFVGEHHARTWPWYEYQAFFLLMFIVYRVVRWLEWGEQPASKVRAIGGKP